MGCRRGGIQKFQPKTVIILVNDTQVLARNVEANSFHGGAFCCVLTGWPLAAAASPILADSLFRGAVGLSNSGPKAFQPAARHLRRAAIFLPPGDLPTCPAAFARRRPVLLDRNADFHPRESPEPDMGSKKTQSEFAAQSTGVRDESQRGLVKKSAAYSALPEDPPAVPFLSSPANTATVAQRRHETLRRFNRLRKHHSAAKAARIVGSSAPTLWRWQKKFAARGLAGLRPKNFKAGRRSPFAGMRLSARAQSELERLTVECSPRAAWLHFAKHSVACPPTVARYVQRTGRAPAQFSGVGRVQPVQARVFVSADGRRIFVKLPARGTLQAQLAVPPKFKLARKAMA